MRTSLLVLALLATGCVATHTSGLEPSQWDYRTETVCPDPGTAAASLDATLSRLGAEGWELVSIDDQSGPEPRCRLLTFKRAKA